METFYNKRCFYLNHMNEVTTMIVQRAKKISNEDFIVYGFFGQNYEVSRDKLVVFSIILAELMLNPHRLETIEEIEKTISNYKDCHSIQNESSCLINEVNQELESNFFN